MPQLLSRRSSHLQLHLLASALPASGLDVSICMQSLVEPAFEPHTTLCRAVPDRISKLINLLRGQRPPAADELSMWRGYNAIQHVQQVLKRGWRGCEHNTSVFLIVRQRPTSRYVSVSPLASELSIKRCAVLWRTRAFNICRGELNKMLSPTSTFLLF